MPAEVRALYLDHNGEQESMEPMLSSRLQPLGLLCEAFDELGEWLYVDVPAFRGRFLPLWTDDNGNYLLYLLTGAEAGMVADLDHERPFKLAPLYRNMESLYAALLEGYLQDDEGLPQDYPLTGVPTAEELAVYEDHLQAYGQTDHEPTREMHAAFLLMLCPAGREQDWLPLLHHREMVIDTARALGERGCVWALGALIETVRGFPAETTLCNNVLEVIAQLDAPETDAALIELATGFPANMTALYVARALERRGYSHERILGEGQAFVASRVAVPGGWIDLPWS
ncbi:SMI1/KNR4 family protein [Deinococcus sp. QL22]|uniref:SMI1/KNR4 family protein n=1 Tax=Deinococcus sp. QL22 TaxID=2939437 RepID=UPI00201718B4|nr:SMI1/KNR4 family protein [Deinococcus sp. QL22]UQN07867.1 SMI1/KNR4 family protein [Deinococcus sp. QL22]